MKKNILLFSSLLLLAGCTNNNLKNDDSNKESKEYDKLLVCNNRQDTGHYSTIHEHYIGFDEKGENITFYKINYIIQEIDEEKMKEAYDHGYTDKDIKEELQKMADKGVENLCEEDDEEFKKYCKSCEAKVVNNSQAIVEQIFTKDYIELFKKQNPKHTTLKDLEQLYESGEYDDGFKGTFSCQIK